MSDPRVQSTVQSHVRDGNKDAQPTGFGRRPILYTTAICATAGVLGHAILWLGQAQNWVNRGVYWQPVFGSALVIVSVTAFGGFYVASQRARVAIAASFLLTFLVSLTYFLTIQVLASVAVKDAAKVLLNDFRTVVLTIIGFYFGTETVVSVTKIIRADPTAVQRVDRDLESSPSRPQGSSDQDQ